MKRLMLVALILLGGCGDNSTTSPVLAPVSTQADYGPCGYAATSILKLQKSDDPKPYYFEEDGYYLLEIQLKGAAYWLEWEDGSTKCTVQNLFY